ncbi:MAG: XRE family transcriptional regulator [Nitrospirales bacterium]
MAALHHFSQWCQFRDLTLSQLAEKSGLQVEVLRSVQNGSLDPSLSLLDSIAAHLQIPTPWLHYDPLVIQRLWNAPEEEDPKLPTYDIADPLFQQIIATARENQDLFLLLTSLVHHGDPKLIRAAQVNLQSLFKQARNVSIPWGSRPPGHFEPPNDY